VARVFYALKYFGRDKDYLEDGFRVLVCPLLSFIENELPEVKKRAKSSGGAPSKAVGNSKMLPTTVVVPPDATLMPFNRLTNGEPVLAQPMVPHDCQAQTTLKESHATAEHALGSSPTMSTGGESSGGGASKADGGSKRRLSMAKVVPANATLKPLVLAQPMVPLYGQAETSESESVHHNGQAKRAPNESNAAAENAAMSKRAKIGGSASNVAGSSKMLPTASNIAPPDAVPMPLNLLANGKHSTNAMTMPKESNVAAENAMDANPTTSIAQTEGYDGIMASIQIQIDQHLQGAAELRKEAENRTKEADDRTQQAHMLLTCSAELRKEAENRTKEADDCTQQAHILKTCLEALKQEALRKKMLIEAIDKCNIKLRELLSEVESGRQQRAQYY
jgi:hypothetical protein